MCVQRSTPLLFQLVIIHSFSPSRCISNVYCQGFSDSKRTGLSLILPHGRHLKSQAPAPCRVEPQPLPIERRATETQIQYASLLLGGLQRIIEDDGWRPVDNGRREQLTKGRDLCYLPLSEVSVSYGGGRRQRVTNLFPLLLQTFAFLLLPLIFFFLRDGRWLPKGGKRNV